MTRLYANRGIWARSIGLGVFLVVVMLWGIWELWAAARGPSANATSGGMFGVIFLAGGVYALYQLATDWRDLVAALDRDDATGALVATVWRPTGPLRLTAPAGELRAWRSFVKVAGRNARTFFIYADHAGHPRPLRFDLKAGTDLTGLRQITPEAVAEYEAAAGIARPA